MMLKNIGKHLMLLPGWRTDRKIIVIESDDWGSIRMPSVDVYNRLQKDGLQPENDPYLRYDSLASETDLSHLFETLRSIRDKNGAFAKITANSVVVNPDFEKIRCSGFTQYHFELFTKTLNKYSNHSNSFTIWKQGISENLFHPQYHGREHINVHQWIKGLSEGDKNLHKAFENEMISISSQKSKMRYAYMESLDFFSDKEADEKAEIIKQGAEIFNDLLGYYSESFIANCYIWNELNEKSLFDVGVKTIQGNPLQLKPNNRNGSHFHNHIFHYTGQHNKIGQVYLTRNVFFEPSLFPEKDNIGECLKRIQMAFRMKKPAIISSHRLNYIGTINEKNRIQNLSSLKQLLTKARKYWPDIEFTTSDKLGSIINDDKT